MGICGLWYNMDLISQINNIQLTFYISEKLENKSKYMLQHAAARRSGMDQTPLRRRLVWFFSGLYWYGIFSSDVQRTVIFFARVLKSAWQAQNPLWKNKNKIPLNIHRMCENQKLRSDCADMNIMYELKYYKHMCMRAWLYFNTILQLMICSCKKVRQGKTRAAQSHQSLHSYNYNPG